MTQMQIELDCRFQAWFKGDMKEQGNQLVSMLDVAISGLGRADRIVPDL